MLKLCTNFSSLSFRPHTYVSYLPRLGHLYSIWCGLKIMHLLGMLFSPVFSYFLHLRPRCIPCYPVIKHPYQMSFGNVNDGVSQLYETTGKIIFVHIYPLYFLDNGETQDSVSDGTRLFLNLLCS